jgi:hypothetical protein
MTKSSTPSRELEDLRERRIELRIALALSEERGAAAEEVELQRAALRATSSRIAALEKCRKFGANG